jgi:hypothetical protein
LTRRSNCVLVGVDSAQKTIGATWYRGSLRRPEGGDGS